MPKKRPKKLSKKLETQTIRDFGGQWTRYRGNEGYYGSVALLRDVLGPLLDLAELEGRRVAEIGSGTGRIVNMLIESGASEVTAIEPSDAFRVLCDNTHRSRDRLIYLNVTGDQIPASNFDYVFSIGVLHHIPNPAPTVAAAYASLRSGGRLVAWLYGKEGNGAYLAFARPLRLFSRRLPHGLVVALVRLLDLPLIAYMRACRHLPLPLAKYMSNVIAPLSADKRRLVLYDQLNPSYAKYYTRQEAHDLLAEAGFTDIRLYHRHQYSWTVIGTRT